MKFAAVAALSALVVLPAEAGQRHRANSSAGVACDNDGRCTTLRAAVPEASSRGGRSKIQSKIATRIPGGATAAPAGTSETRPPPAAANATVAASGITTDSDGATAASIPLPMPKPRAAALDGNGNSVGIVISSKTGARARVGVGYAARFQAYIDDLENNHGARVLFMGGIRPGRCLPQSQHPCGRALDVCQLGWGRVDPRCKLPDRVTLGRIAAAHGLFEGGRWCHSDYGHAQISVTAAACGDGPFRIVRRTPSDQAGDEARPY